MLNHLLKLYSYERWANTQVLSAIAKAPELPPHAMKLFAHIFAAHEFIGKRVRSQPVNYHEYNFFPDYSCERCAELNEHYAVGWHEFLHALPGPIDRQTVTFTGPDGNPRTIYILDALTHLYSHSIYHRGQIAMDMRNAGLEPAKTDLIMFTQTRG